MSRALLALLASGGWALAAACSSSGQAPRDAGSPTDARADAPVDAEPAADGGLSDARPADAPAPLDAVAEADSPSGPACDQTLLGYPLPPAPAQVLRPRTPIQPFYQWENNDGYCGEVSMMQAGLANGQWMSQYDARLLCGASAPGADGGREPALQSGPDGYCAAHGKPYEYAQLLFTCRAGCAASAVCLDNARLDAEVYQTPAGKTGVAAYRDFMGWVKSRVAQGRWVTVGVLWKYGHDSEYDHIVSVTGVGTSHDPADPAYHGDDVLYWDDHGLYTFERGALANNPAVPHGAGADVRGCTPYVFADTFDDLGRGRADQRDGGVQPYAFPLPAPGVRNYAFAVKGPLDGDGETLPVALRITGTTTGGAPNPADPRAGFDYEAPFIGTLENGASCTNAPPSSWMQMTAEVTVSGLTAGTAYVLYEYRSSGVSGLGAAAALAVPTSGFNAHASMATRATPFTAAGPTFTTAATFSSDTVVVFRAVAASAP